jgi:hypothetical protein
MRSWPPGNSPVVSRSITAKPGPGMRPPRVETSVGSAGSRAHVPVQAAGATLRQPLGSGRIAHLRGSRAGGDR